MVSDPQLGGDTFQGSDNSNFEVLIVLFDNFEAQVLGGNLKNVKVLLRKI